MPRLWHLNNVTRLTLAHNKISEIPSAMANLENMEILNLCNNSVEELPVSISTMPKLRILNLSMNRLSKLPRGFGSFPALEVSQTLFCTVISFLVLWKGSLDNHNIEFKWFRRCWICLTTT